MDQARVVMKSREVGWRKERPMSHHLSDRVPVLAPADVFADLADAPMVQLVRATLGPKQLMVAHRYGVA